MRSLFAFSAACRRVVVTAAAIGMCLFGIGARDTHADIIVALPGEPVEFTAPFTWSYDVFLASGQEVRFGASFTIYDFAGFMGEGSTAAPDDWDFSLIPIVCAECDNDLDPDLTWTYMGEGIFPGGTPDSPEFLGVFSAGSEFGYDTAVDAWFAGLAYADSTSTEPLVFNSAEDTQGPSAPEVPEPGSMLLLATGLFGAAAMIRRRQAAQV